MFVLRKMAPGALVNFALLVFCTFWLGFDAQAEQPKTLTIQKNTKHSAALCLAANLYHEARGEPAAGQLAVALVTMNRAAQNPAKVCNVVFSPKQFSWTNQYVSKVPGGWKLAPRLYPADARAWEQAKKTARLALSNRVRDFTKGATHYHTTEISPYWANSDLKRVGVIGKHLFYTPRRIAA